MAEPKDKTKQGAGKMSVRLVWPTHSQFGSSFANQAQVSRTGPEYVLEFGEFLPTGFLNRSTEELVDAYGTPQAVKVVSRVVMTPEFFREVAKMIAKRVEDDEKSIGQARGA